MKKRTLTIFIAGFILVGSIVFLSYKDTFHTITFDIKDNTNTVTIFKVKGEDYTELKRINNNDDNTATLREGKYIYLVSGEKITLTQDELDVSSSKTITIDPDYSQSYLNKLLTQEKNTIQRAITKQYPTITQKYTITGVSLYKKGEWGGALILPKIKDPNDLKDVYRVVLHKEDGIWKIIRYPEIVLTSNNYPGVPIEIINVINITGHE